MDCAKLGNEWDSLETPDKWLKALDVSGLKAQFLQQGFLNCEGLLDENSVRIYKKIYDDFLSGEIDASYHRHDLGSHVGTKEGQENITQIMWPSSYVPQLRKGPIHQRLELLARAILGDDMAFDFDMMISKPPNTDVTTPWHQDEAYWLDMPDKRAVSFWVALQDVDVNNGCMWFVPGSHKQPLREHWKAKEGHHVETCECAETEGNPVPLSAGGFTGHHGRTLHYTRGNMCDHPRRAFIVNFRPQAMIDFERSSNYDFGLAGLDGIIHNPKQS